MKKLAPCFFVILLAWFTANGQSKQPPHSLDILDHRSGLTPLVEAVNRNDLLTAQNLLQRGASPDAAGRCGLTPLITATLHCNLAMVKLLLAANANPLNQDCTGKNALTIAEETKCSQEILGLLNQSAVVFNQHRVVEQQQLFETLTAMDQTEKVQLLLTASRKELNLDSQDETGKTPLMFAAMNGNFDLVQLFVLEGASTSTVDKDGRTALDLAQQAQKTNIVVFLQRLVSKKETVTGSSTVAGKVLTNAYFGVPNNRERDSDGGYGGGSVYVRGYYRKNGTYVHSYTRSAPGSGHSRSRH